MKTFQDEIVWYVKEYNKRPTHMIMKSERWEALQKEIREVMTTYPINQELVINSPEIYMPGYQTQGTISGVTIFTADYE